MKTRHRRECHVASARSSLPSSRRFAVAILLGIATTITTLPAKADGDAERGSKEFGVCAACHSLSPTLNKTGPSLATVWDRNAGSLANFDRYSSALKAFGAAWNQQNLDAWLANPAGFIPGNYMTFQGIHDAPARADIIAFLKAVGEAGRGGAPVNIPAAYTETPLNLKKLGPERVVTAIRSCGESYFVTTADGQTRPFWDESLRFETDASEMGPVSGKPAILPSGMFGDRAAVIFAHPSEISSFIRQLC